MPKFEEVARTAHAKGDRVAIEWPRACAYWRLTKVKKLMSELGMRPARFDGCALGLKSPEGVPMRKPWAVAANDEFLADALEDRRCPGCENHARVAGNPTKGTQSYPLEMVRLIRSRWQEPCLNQERVSSRTACRP